jgi:hypothetical protein
LANELYQFAGRLLKTSCPIAMQIECLGGLWKQPDPRIIKGPNNFDTPICRSLVGDHDLDTLICLPYNGVQAGFEMTFTVEYRNDHRDDGL